MGVSQRRVRIAYLAHGMHGRHDGVRAKILAQASMWAELDRSVEVGVFVRCETDAEEDWRGQPNVVSVRSSRLGVVGRLVAREVLSGELARWRPDVVYLRYSTVSPSVMMIARSVPTVIELNTLDLSELRVGSPLRYRWARATRSALLRRARGVVVVAEAIARDPSISAVNVPTIVIPNSVDLRRFEPMLPPHNDSPRLAFVGAPRTPWHGVDKIVRMAHYFPQWSFDLIGPSRDDVSNPPPNVRAHGLLVGANYRPILAKADVAIGALALHRLDLSEASPLKVGEYLAYGIPTITGYADTRFPNGAPFILQLPNTEDNVECSIDSIRSFVAEWQGRRVRRAAIQSIDAGSVESRRLQFMLDAVHG